MTLFKIIKHLLSNKTSIADMKDKDLNTKGKELKKAILDMETELERKAEETGKTVDQYMKDQGWSF